MTPLTENARFI